MSLPEFRESPRWSANNKRFVIISLMVGALLIVYRVRGLLLPFVMAVILAYLVEPLVRYVHTKTRIPRIVVIVVIYLMITAVLAAIPISAIPPIVGQVNVLIDNFPTYIFKLGVFVRELQEPIVITEDIIIPLDQWQLDQAFLTVGSNLLNIVQGFGGQTISIFSNVVGWSLSTIGWVVVVLFLSFYLVKDYEQLFAGLLKLAPENYHGDLIRLSKEMSLLWNAFLRGQLLLCLVVAGIVFMVAVTLGLPSALLLAAIAGLMEFFPTIGPILAAIPAVIVGYIQAESSWLGQITGPFWFVVIIIIIYAIIYQTENYVLLPRIIGYRLRLHPVVVILGAIAGASIAGILGILLAAPFLASMRLIFSYIYCKLRDVAPFPEAKPESLLQDVVIPDKRLDDSGQGDLAT
ncbi:MAG: AI-2E family transporter [Anaerolineae bacterium]|nr:AI-2E family transporter [Anaerolineae bacterium]